MQIRIIRSVRRSISIEIKLDEMIVRAPKGMSRKQIDDFLYKKRSWIEKHFKIMEEKKVYLDKVKPLTKEEIQALADKACKVLPKKVRYYAPLCHRKHMNHSAEFYTEVERVYPDYRKWNKWLKEHGEIIMRNR